MKAGRRRHNQHLPLVFLRGVGRVGAGGVCIKGKIMIQETGPRPAMRMWVPCPNKAKGEKI
jgi:hypothetical protein